jgi:membrane AbrB-like protein
VLAGLVACVLFGLGAEAVRLPAPWLFAGLLGGLLVAAAPRGSDLEMPRAANLGSQAVVGLALAAAIVPASLAGVARAWWVVIGVVVLTLALSGAVALALAKTARIDRRTAAIGMLPGTAPASIAVADELGADEPLVATMQYGRVLLVVATVPLMALLLPTGGAAPAGTGAPAPAPGVDAVAGAAVVGAAGIVGARLLRAPAAALVGPLALGTLANVTGPFAVAVPEPVVDAALVVVGASVGLGLDRPALRRVGRVLPVLAGAMLALTAGCAGIGGLVFAALGTDPLTAYLATTPGGISSVLAASYETGADLTIVVAVQTLRLMVLALLAPFAARLMRAGAPA